MRKDWFSIGFLLLLAFGIGGVVASVAVPVRNSLLLKQTHHDLRWIGMALHRYHDEQGAFPPVVVRDGEGVAIHSWRSLIEPQMAAIVETPDDFTSYEMSEPWNSPGNSNTSSRHRFGSHPYQFLAIVGPQAAWRADGTRQLTEFTDGPRATVLVIGLRRTGVDWHEPRDAAFDGNLIHLDGRPLDLTQDVFLLTADGMVRYHKDGLPAEILAAMITIAGGETVTEW